MASLNKVFLMGNLTREPDLRCTANGKSLANFGLAINRKFKKGDDWKDEVCFVDITVWGKQAENCDQYLNKGKGVLVEGRLQYRSWETDDGQKRSKLEVVANNVQFLPSGNGQSAPEGSDVSVSDDVPF